MKLQVAVAVTLVVLLAPFSAQALSLYANGTSFSVDVRNRHFQNVSQAQGSVWISGDRAQIEVRADGYRTAREYVYLRPNQTWYNVSVRLDDPAVWFRVRDAVGATVAEASARENNVGVWGDEFRFEVTVPAEGFSRFGRNDVDVRIDGGFAFGERVAVWDLGTSRRIEVVVKRRDMHNEFSSTFTVTVPRDEQLGPARRDLVRAVAFALQQRSGELSAEQRAALEARLADLRR